MIEFLIYPLEIFLLMVLNYLLFKKSKGKKDIQFLIVLNGSLILWIVSTILVLVFNTDPSSVWFVRITFAATAIAVASFILFVESYIKKKISKLGYILVAVGLLVVGLSFTNIFIQGLDVYSGATYPAVEYGPYPWLYMIYIVGGILFSVTTIFVNRNKMEGTQFLRIRYTLLGLVTTGIIAVVTNIILPLLTDTAATSVWGTVSVSAISITTSYAVLNTRLFGIKYIIQRIVYNLFKIFLISTFYFGVTFLSEWLSNSYFSVNKSFSIIALVAISLFTYYYLVELAENNVFKRISREGTNRNRIKDSFTRKVSTELSLESLTQYLLDTFMRVFNLSNGSLVLLNLQEERFLYKDFNRFSTIKSFDFEYFNIVEYFQSKPSEEILVLEELEYRTSIDDPKLQKIYQFMKAYKVSAVVSLNRTEQFQGILLLGERKSRTPYTSEEIDFLLELKLSASVAYSRSLLYKEVQDFNNTLQQKVNIQTKELQQKVKELEEARRKEADMIDIMGHELRTPATIVKLNAQLLEQVIQKKDIKALDKYVVRIKDGVEREIKLINTLLSSAKLEGDKIKIEPEEVNLKAEIEMAIHAYEKQAKQKGLKLIDNTPEKISTVFGDHARIVEIINNLTSNAVKYTEQGSVTIEASEYGGVVQLDFIDTGLGIPAKDIPNLGKKFYRVQTYIESEDGDDIDVVRPGGTGLGLYVVFQLVKKMGGEVNVHSELGKGSTFSITLPKYVGQDSTKSKAKESLNMFERMGLKREENIQD